MLRTRVGYSGGKKADPTYYSLGDHTETIQIDFDPERVSYDHLLELATMMGNFDGSDFSRQYRSVVFYHNKEQLQTARKLGISKLEPVGTFTRAEDYHQKYYLQQSSIVSDFYKRYPTARAFTDSAAVTKANGIVGGNLELEKIRKITPSLGVSDGTTKAMLGMAGRSLPGCAIPKK